MLMNISLRKATILAGAAGTGLGLLFGEILVASPLNKFLGPTLPGLESLQPVGNAIIGGIGATCLAAAMLAVARLWRGVLRAIVMISIVIQPPLLVFCWRQIIDGEYIQASVMWGAASVGACLGIQGARWPLRPKNNPQP